MASTVEQIKNRLNIVDVVGSYLKLEKAGVNLKSRCPFHNEKTPSFFVSPDRDSYYCFGCGRKGDIFNFVQDFEGVDFVGSLKILADRAGVEIKKGDFSKKSENEKLFSILENATAFYQKKLAKSQEVKKYLKKRGLTEETIKDFRIGFAPDAWRELKDFLTSTGFQEKDLKKAGLLKESSGKTYDTFRGRVMFVINDPSGRPIAFSGRTLVDDEKGAKYINSPETEIFKKSKNLFAYDKARFEMRKKDFAILVEGTVDAIMAHQVGYRNVVAPLGTSLTKEQLEKISRLTKKVVLAFDSDGAGFKASGRGAKIALSMGIDLKVATIPKGFDPADLIQKDIEDWKKVIRESKHVVEFYLGKLKAEENDSRKLGLRVREEILPFVAQVSNKIDQAHFIKLLSQTLNISEEAVYSEVEKVDLKGLDVTAADEAILEKEESDRRKTILRKISGLILWQETLKEKAIDTSFGKKELKRISQKEDILKNFDKKALDEIIFEANISYDDDSDLKEEFEELLLRLEEDYLQEEFTKKISLLKEAEEKKDKKEEEKLLKECQNLSKKINKIRSKFNHY